MLHYLGIEHGLESGCASFLISNTAAELGGGVYATMRINIKISEIILFENNIANYGAACFSRIFTQLTLSIVGMISIVINIIITLPT